MLRIALVILLLANAGYFAYGQGWFEPIGLKQTTTTEPDRPQQQLRPEAIQIADPKKPSRRDVAVNPTAACLQSAPIEEAQIATVRAVLAGKVPESRYTIDEQTTPARWIVYMGRYADADALAKKKAELRARGVPFEPTNNGSLEPGLTLASAPSREEINRRLEALAQKGVRTARVLEERPAGRSYVLRVPAADEALRSTLSSHAPDVSMGACPKP